jgi:hypothetical protein
VSWVPPSAQVTPAVYTITLTVVDPGVPGAAQQITTSSVTVRYNDSIKENADLALLFLADFSNYNVSPEQCVRNFSDACAGKQEELADIRNNRLNYRILSGTFRVSQVNLLNARTRSNIVAPCTFRSTVNATGQLEVATGTCYMTGVYENFRWRLCESYFTGTVSDPPAGAVPGRVLPRSTAPFGRED